MVDYKQCKSKAKEDISGNMGILFLCLLICYAAPGVVNVIPVVGQLASIAVSPLLMLGTAIVYLNLARGVAPDIKMLMESFQKDFINVFLMNFLIGIFIMLWSLLLIVPGIIKGLSYSMANYILAENREIQFMDAIKASQVMMDGHKMELFMMYVHFIPWSLLTMVTFGIAGIYTVPYMNAALANFYLELKAQLPVPEVVV